jgi:hypothetical protein
LTLPTPIPLAAATVGVVVIAAVAHTVAVEGMIRPSGVDIAAAVASALVVGAVCYDWIIDLAGSLSRASRSVPTTMRLCGSTSL